MPVKTKIYRVGGEAAEMDAIDARHALQNHPSEWFQTAVDAKAAAPKEAPAPVKSVFEAKHRGGGSYSVLDADGKEMLEKLSKEDAELFNSSTEDEQAKFIETELAKRS